MRRVVKRTKSRKRKKKKEKTVRRGVYVLSPIDSACAFLCVRTCSSGRRTGKEENYYFNGVFMKIRESVNSDIVSY